jgi:hypothetical protein
MSEPATPTPAAPAAPTTFLGNMLAKLKAAAAPIINVVEHVAWPFVENLFTTIALDNVHALEPLAVEALGEVEGELRVLFSQGVEGFLKVFDATVAGLYTKATAASLKVSETDILTAAHAAVLNAKAALPATAAGT